MEKLIDAKKAGSSILIPICSMTMTSVHTEKGNTMYKCCWNCINGYKAFAKTNAETELVNASKRFCCASYPVSYRLENPFKKRYCKQFEADFKYRTEPLIDKKEAERLIGMNAEELLEYWREQHG